MAEDRIGLPSSGGGLVRYSEDYKSKFELTPVIVIAAIVIVAVIEIYLYKFL